MNTIRTEVLQAVREVVPVDPSLVAESTRVTDLILDSLDYLEIMIMLNTRFQVPFEPSDMEGIETLRDLVDYVVRKRESPVDRTFVSLMKE